MKVVILAGGKGTRLSEETSLKPKPMVEIGSFPILWHLMKIYSSFGFNEFIICCGYKGYLIKEYFSNYFLHTSDVSFDLKNNKVDFLNSKTEPWKVTLVDTGEETLTGGRLKRIRGFLDKDETFCMTYGDGLSNIDIKKLVEFPNNHDCDATVTAVIPPGRFGSLAIGNNNDVTKFHEKPNGDNSFINGGFFVLNSNILDQIDGDHILWEKDPIDKLVQTNNLKAFKHEGFWQPMDTLREKNLLESLWNSDKCPWKTWDE